VNRAGASSDNITGKDVAGAWEKIAICDGVLSIGAKQADRDRGELIVRISEFRNTAPGAIRIKTNYGMGRFYEEFVDYVYSS